MNIKELVNEKLKENLRKTSPGIYFIYCTTDNKIYIGSSSNISKRLNKHRELLLKQRHENSYLQNAWQKYGPSSFIFGVLENTENLITIEQRWLDDIKCYERGIGFNICKTASSTIGYKHTLESKLKMRKSKPNAFYSQERREMLRQIALSNFLGSKAHNTKLNEDIVRQIKQDLESKLSYKDIAKKYNSNANIIGRIARGERWKHVVST